MIKLKIDPEFRDKIPALTEAEFEQLRENILSDGEVYEPIVTWNSVIIDGHNRWRIICENWEKLKDKYRVKEMNFADKWEAFEWMYRKQLGRRNLSDEQKKYMIGKMYEARKQSQGGKRGTSVDPETGRFTANGQNVHLRVKREVKDGTAGEIGKEIGVDGRTVRRAEKFAKGIDAVRDESPEAADNILKGGSGITASFVASIPSMNDAEKKQAIEAVKSGSGAVAAFKKNTEEAPKKAPAMTAKEERANREAIHRIVQEMYDVENLPQYTFEMLIEDIELNSRMFIDLMRNILTEHSTLLTKENRPAVGAALDKSITDEIKKLKELVAK